MKLERIIAIIACNEDYYNNEWPHPELHGLMPHENFHAKSIADELAGVSATYLGCT
ncbi:MAG: hypothetical protein NZM25_01685 [Leptospiraceae bacterium]|nr:hypothetical protein [Leptospiraceae bacterium]MDW8306888.1 hypothetical protein [Leptospiraceae bacterium]